MSKLHHKLTIMTMKGSGVATSLNGSLIGTVHKCLHLPIYTKRTNSQTPSLRGSQVTWFHVVSYVDVLRGNLTVLDFVVQLSCSLL